MFLVDTLERVLDPRYDSVNASLGSLLVNGFAAIERSHLNDFDSGYTVLPCGNVAHVLPEPRREREREGGSVAQDMKRVGKFVWPPLIRILSSPMG